MLEGRVDDSLLQIDALAHVWNAQCATGFIGQCVHDRGVKVIAGGGHAIERLATLIKCLIGRAVFNHVLTDCRGLATNAVDERTLDVAVANLQPHLAGPPRHFFQGMQCEPPAVSGQRGFHAQASESPGLTPLLCIPTGLLQHFQGNSTHCFQAGELFGIGIEQNPASGGITQPRAGALQFFEQWSASAGVGFEQPQGVRQLRWRRKMIHVHLAQGIVLDTTGLGDVEQLLIGKCLGGMADAPKQCQPIPGPGTLQRMAPGAMPVVFEYGLPGIRISRMPDAPFLQRRVKGCFVDLATLPNEGFAIYPVQPRRIRD
ncbi:hypothetical protein D3C87_1052740 [compost metagenome]